ncbi:MAG: ADP-heptose:LPS heptosyltransferase [Motiliproteus sp.]|jgi:ADP-heptose:LPS heptosyltransferase
MSISTRQQVMKILVVRNDKLGDFMLAWPCFQALKQAFPESRVVALVPNYTRPIAELCPWIDEILTDPTEAAGKEGFNSLLKQVKVEHYDLLLTLFSTTRIGLLGFRAGIPVRWAPATKLAQLFYNRRLKQRRSQSQQPEYAYNLDLTQAAIEDCGGRYKSPEGPYLRVDAEMLTELRQEFLNAKDLAPSTRLIFIHSGHGGSANNLSLAQYAELARKIARPDSCFILTAGPGELEATRTLAALLDAEGISQRIFSSTEGLQHFAQQLALADLFIAGSTGTLHIAGALDRPTVGFYPNRRSSTPLRWRTLNGVGRTLAITPPSEIEQDMSQVDIGAAAKAISAFIDEVW